jgi:predicted DNA-binding mobile mystery protein A
MKTNRRNLLSQRRLMEKKIRPWTALRADKAPGSGWIKAVRGALGMSARQLADRIGVEQSTVTRLEERESVGKVTLESLATVAKAMDCKLVYAIVPNERYRDFETIVNERAQGLARQLVERAEHSMQLEKQGTDAQDLDERIATLANQLKAQMDVRIWGKGIRSSISAPAK